MRGRALLLLVAGAAVHLGAQQSWWRGRPLLLEPERNVAWVEVPGEGGKVLRRPWATLGGGSLYALGWGCLWRLDPGRTTHGLFRTRDGQLWEPMGTLSGPLPSAYVPLGEEALLLASDRSPYVLGKGASPFAVARREGRSGEFRIARLLPLVEGGLWERFAEPGKGLPEESPHLFAPRPQVLGLLRSLADYRPLLPLPGGAALVGLRSGRIWTFDARGGLRGGADLLEAHGLAASPEDPFKDLALLAALPTAEGQILVASCAGAEQNRLTWWRFDPGKGSLSRLAEPPPGAPVKLPDSEAECAAWVRSFPFHVGPAGDLLP